MKDIWCYACGRDCSNLYGTYKGYPYHFGCFPDPPKKRVNHGLHPSPNRNSRDAEDQSKEGET